MADLCEWSLYEGIQNHMASRGEYHCNIAYNGAWHNFVFCQFHMKSDKKNLHFPVYKIGFIQRDSVAQQKCISAIWLYKSRRLY